MNISLSIVQYTCVLHRIHRRSIFCCSEMEHELERVEIKIEPHEDEIVEDDLMCLNTICDLKCEPQDKDYVIGTTEDSIAKNAEENLLRNDDYLKKNKAKKSTKQIIKRYHCNVCSYKAQFPRDLKRHSLIHLNPAETELFRCELCPYETKIKGYLRQHSRIHQSLTESSTVHKCEDCDYVTKFKRDLNRHALRHRDASEVIMHKCDQCAYESRFKGHLRRHMLIHQNSDAVRLYVCDICHYAAKLKDRLNKHYVTHIHPSQFRMFKCDKCNFETKYKNNFKNHVILLHDAPKKRKKRKAR